MRVELRPYRAADLAGLTLQPSQAAWRDLAGEATALALESAGPAWSLVAGDQTLACGGVVDRGAGRGEAWMLLGADAGRRMLRLTRIVRAWLEIAPYRRIEAASACAFPPGGRWLALLGFENEGPMTAYCQDGGAAIRWALIRQEETTR